MANSYSFFKREYNLFKYLKSFNMKTIKNILMLTVMLVSFNSSNAQIKNENTDSEKISGNCGMCKKTIEKAGNVKDIASVNWDKETKIVQFLMMLKKQTKMKY